MAFNTTLFKVAKLAVKAEEAGEAYYRRIAQVVKDEKVKKICLFFAEQEKEHKKVFHKLAEQAKKDDVERTFSIDVIQLLEEGIEQFGKTGFQDPDMDYSNISVSQCLQIVLDAELEAIKIYQEIQREIESNYNVFLYQIIREETDHAETVRNVIKKASGEEKGAVVPRGKPSDGVTVEKERGKVYVKRVAYRASRKELFNISLIAMVFIILVLAMTGPKILSYVVDVLMAGEGFQF